MSDAITPVVEMRGISKAFGAVQALENVSLRLLLAQAEINTRSLLAKAGIDAKEREASDKLQKLILEELHHRIKNTLATVGAIASQSLRNAPSMRDAQHAIEGRLLALGRAHDLLLQVRWTGADLRKIVSGATEPFDNADRPRFSIDGRVVFSLVPIRRRPARPMTTIKMNKTAYLAVRRRGWR